MTITDYLTSDEIDNQNLGLRLLGVPENYHLSKFSVTLSIALRIFLQKEKISFLESQTEIKKSFTQFLYLFCNLIEEEKNYGVMIYFISFKKVNYD